MILYKTPDLAEFFQILSLRKNKNNVISTHDDCET